MTNSCIGARVVRTFVCVAIVSVILGCDAGNFVFTEVRIYHSPYAHVDWANDLRLKAQHHDHFFGRPGRILAYDAAGYDVLTLMDYSGNSWLRFTLPYRLWPPERWVESWVREQLVNVKLFIPGGEELGLYRQHFTSPFLETYIEVEPEAASPASELHPLTTPKQPWQYSSREEMFDLIEQGGGLPCFAHSWDYGYDNVRGKFCAEIYNAYGAAQRSFGDKAFVDWDRNQELVKNWDYSLQFNQEIFGIAVNDHFGPDSRRVSAEIRDSGKIVVLAPSATRADYEARFREGAFFAVKDLGAVKDRFPEIYAIDVAEESVFIETFAHVDWIAQGELIASGPLLLYEDLPIGARYVRAEVSDDAGSVVYTQPFVVRPVGDADGDYDVDLEDLVLCTAAEESMTDDVADACEAAASGLQ